MALTKSVVTRSVILTAVVRRQKTAKIPCVRAL